MCSNYIPVCMIMVITGGAVATGKCSLAEPPSKEQFPTLLT